MEKPNYKNKNIEKNNSNTWYDWGINYIPEAIKRIVGAFIDLTQTQLNKLYATGKKQLK